MSIKEMSFLSDVEGRKAGSVWEQIKDGSVDVNRSFVGVYPLTMAVEQGDVDTVAVLLTFGADPEMTLRGARTKTVTELCKQMAQDKKGKYRAEAAIMLEMIKDKEACKRRFDSWRIPYEEQSARDHARTTMYANIVVVVLLLVLIVLYVNKFGWVFPPKNVRRVL